MLWGCDKPAKQKVYLEGELLLRCPKREFLNNPEDISELLWYYSSFKKGVLPDRGGLLDQPAKMMECFKVIDNAIGTVEAQKNAEQQQAPTAPAARR